ncbi:MAG: hypothetical protein H0U75_09275 [Legionella sp.]|nr:hypothetical protein [Legionella sp.]
MRKEIQEKLENLKQKTFVDISNLQIKNNEILEVMQQIFLVQPHISIMNLDGNQLSNEGAITLSTCLGKFSELSQLSLQFNKIDRSGAIALFSLKNVLPNLTISFHGNTIHDTEEMADIEQLAKEINYEPPKCYKI